MYTQKLWMWKFEVEHWFNLCPFHENIKTSILIWYRFYYDVDVSRKSDTARVMRCKRRAHRECSNTCAGDPRLLLWRSIVKFPLSVLHCWIFTETPVILHFPCPAPKHDPTTCFLGFFFVSPFFSSSFSPFFFLGSSRFYTRFPHPCRAHLDKRWHFVRIFKDNSADVMGGTIAGTGRVYLSFPEINSPLPTLP